jgi:hypothetical protein
MPSLLFRLNPFCVLFHFPSFNFVHPISITSFLFQLGSSSFPFHLLIFFNSVYPVFHSILPFFNPFILFSFHPSCFSYNHPIFFFILPVSIHSSCLLSFLFQYIHPIRHSVLPVSTLYILYSIPSFLFHICSSYLSFHPPHFNSVYPVFHSILPVSIRSSCLPFIPPYFSSFILIPSFL